MQRTEYRLFASRLKAGGIHFVISAFVAILAALVVFGIWYPYPYSEISGGRELFLMVVSVDVIIGPLITLIIYDIKKSARELRRDIFVVAMLQMLALGYGLWTLAIARPVHLVFEIDRFRVVHAVDVPGELIIESPNAIVILPYSGPTLLGLRAFKGEQEKLEATIAALLGLQLSFRPDLWQSYEVSRADVLRAAKPVAQLKVRFPAFSKQIDAAIGDKVVASEFAQYVPLAGRKEFWTVLVDGRNGDVLGFLPLDSF